MFEPFVTGALLDDRLVRNKPLSAVFESETTQKRANGTTVTRRVTTRLYRDKDGRTRREQIFHANGSTSTPDQALQTITVYDPVGGWGYSIDPIRSTASRYKLSSTPPTGAPFNNQLPLVTKITRNNPQTGTVNTYTLAPPILQPLGIQTIAGVEAEGLRVTIKVPAGAIGNSTANETVYEMWIARDLKILVKSVVSNPASGTQTHLLTTINRTEPASSLFTVPAGYTVNDMGVIRTDLPPPIQ